MSKDKSLQEKLSLDLKESLKEKKELKIFILSTFIIAVIYFSFSVFLSLFSTKPFPKGNIIDLILSSCIRYVCPEMILLII